MPKEIKDPEEFRKIAQRAEECRVKLGVRQVRTKEGSKRIQVLKVKARTSSNLYTIVFEDIDKGIEFAKSLKGVCKNIVVLDAELEPKMKE